MERNQLGIYCFLGSKLHELLCDLWGLGLHMIILESLLTSIFYKNKQTLLENTHQEAYFQADKTGLPVESLVDKW